MRQRIRIVAVVGIALIGVSAVMLAPAQAGCGGGRGGFFGRSRAAAPASCGGGCGMNMAGATMPGMDMSGMNMAPAAAPVAAAPAAAGHFYTCPMHPSVVSAAPGRCPYCHMALTYR